MGIHKKYKGYKSFDYLEKGKDFKVFDLVEKGTPFKPFLLSLTPNDEAKAQGLAEKTIMISLHEHPHLFPADIRETMAYEKEVRIATGFEALSESL